MFLLVGLGNPGDEYSSTRHNIGFLFLDHLAAGSGLVFKKSKWQAEVVKGGLWNSPVLLAKPLTFMNRSGDAVGLIARFHDVAASRVVVVHDDLDLPFGRVKVVVNRGPSGHNGVKSIIDHLGTRDFPRIRVGVGRPPGEATASQFVLGRFSSEELRHLPSLFGLIEKAAQLIVTEGVLRAMTLINADNGHENTD